MDQMRARLSSLGVARITGGDAVSFMQAHFCNDVQDTVPGRVQLSGYCNPKGRLLAVFHLAHTVTETGDAFLLVAPHSVLKPMLERLAMFAKMARPAGKEMFAQVTKTDIEISDCTDELTILGLGGAKTIAAAADKLSDHSWPGVGEAHNHAGLTLIAPVDWHPAGEGAESIVNRILCVGTEEQIATIETAAANNGSALIDEERWLLEDIRVGVPVVFPETQDQFVPQMANMHRLAGLSFSKGCYPGQEIVARMQYLGKLKRRTERFVYSGEALVPGTVVEDGDGAEVGVVMSSASDGGSGEALVVVRIASASSSATVKGEGDTLVPLAAAPLPYAFDDAAESSA